ncbi:hypothetical protein J5N97_021990 [Dioscorea zingiberensis]|uniref:RING-type E3 ubiquitin transferase n=1 Tax=Dioscorea zingiberensis TaxID=325984 RepID=A0A9D5CAB9_9LILI|nr:hypothetical protein J5N97_021990 [Dioscorea zingiberensis]
MAAREDHETPLEKLPRRLEEEMKDESMLSPGFRSAAALAGWDEEALLLASLIVEDTPVRESRHKKRPGLLSKTPSSTHSIRKRRSQRQSPGSMPAVVLCLDDEEKGDQEDVGEKRREEGDDGVNEKEKNGEEGVSVEKDSGNGVPCIDRLREELSCAICLEVCFEPSTTPCGHSFCMKCLKSSASKCGKKCPKCRQLISNVRSYTVNTVLWNTIQLLFPKDIEVRKKAIKTKSPTSEAKIKTSLERRIRNTITRNARTISHAPRAITRDDDNNSSNRRIAPNQSQDAALALRLQREEFMEAFGENDTEQQPRNISVYAARNNLRAMASRAANFRRRGRFPFILD